LIDILIIDCIFFAICKESKEIYWVDGPKVRCQIAQL